jgi:hypothetical protein
MTKVRLLLLACLGCAILSLGEFNTRGLRAEEPVPVPVPCPNQMYESVLCADPAPGCVQTSACGEYKGSVRANGPFDVTKTKTQSGVSPSPAGQPQSLLCYTSYACVGKTVNGIRSCVPDTSNVGQPFNVLNSNTTLMCSVITPPVPTVP